MQGRFPHLPADPVVVGIPAYAPYVYPCALEMTEFGDPNCPLPGIDVEIFHYIMHYLNASYILKPLHDVNSWGPDGLLGDLNNGTFDTMSIWYRITDDRLKTFEYAYPMPYISLQYGFLLQKAGISMSLHHANVLHEVFPKELWMYTGAVCLILYFLHILTLNCVDWKNGKNFSSIHDINLSGVWSSVSLTVDQWNGVNSYSMASANIVFFVLGFSLLFLVSLYSSSLVGALMSVPNLIPFIRMSEFADLVASGKYRVANDNGAGSEFFWNLVETSQSEAYLKLNGSLNGGKAQHSEETVEGILNALEDNPNLVYPGQDYLNGGIYLVRGRCKLHFIMDREAPTMTDIGFIFKRGNVWAAPIREALVSSINVIQHIEAKYVEMELAQNRLECNSLEAREGDPLKLRHFFGVVALCGILIGIGFLFFFCEITADLRKKFKHRKVAKQHDETPVPTASEASSTTLAPMGKSPWD